MKSKTDIQNRIDDLTAVANFNRTDLSVDDEIEILEEILENDQLTEQAITERLENLMDETTESDYGPKAKTERIRAYRWVLGKDFDANK